MPRKRTLKRPSVKKQLEDTPDIAFKEIAFYKEPRGKLVEISGIRFADAVNKSRDPTRKEKIEVHIHPWPEKKNELAQALPSPTDLLTLLENMGASGMRTEAIASINAEGKVIGYTISRLPKMDKGERKGLENYLKLAQSHFYSYFPNPMKDWPRFIKDLDIKQRFVPAKGFELDRETMIFIEKKSRLSKAWSRVGKGFKKIWPKRKKKKRA